MKAFLTLLLFLLFCSLGNRLAAQSNSIEKEKTTLQKIEKESIPQKQNIDTELDTEESLKYMGAELLFQVKKRLHLTTEEEEKQKEQQKGKKSVVFNILGIKIERG